MRRACLVAIVVTCMTAPGTACGGPEAKSPVRASRVGIAGGGAIQLLGSADRKRYFDNLAATGAGWSAAQTSFTIARRTQTRTSIYTSGDTQLDLRSLFPAARSATRPARFFDDTARPMTLRTSLGDAENSA